MQKRIVISIIVAATFFINACAPAYVATEPTYIEVQRPLAPTPTHVWIGNEWIYNNRTRMYVHKDGYWAAPQRSRTYQQGHWNSTNRGHLWVSGRWN